MKVLIADDDPAARFALKRLLLRDFMATVSEVENGIDALDALSRERYSFMLLDMQMPLMDGIETLHAIRSNPELVSFPVVVMTIVKNEEQVRQIVRLGISDYLAKPLKLGAVAARLNRLVKSFGALETVPQLPLGSMLDLDEHPPIMIADGDAEFRHFFTNLFTPQFVVASAESGARALKMCLAAPPRALFVGVDLGALGQDILVRKLRTLPQFNRTRIIAVAPSNLLPSIQQSAPYDGGMPRTFVPEVLQQNFDRLVGVRNPLEQLVAIYPALRVNAISATEQVFAMILALEVMLQSAEQPLPEGIEGLRASVGIAVPREALELTVRLTASADAARQLATRLAAGERGRAADGEPSTALGEITTIIAARLHKGFAERGIQATCGAPIAEVVHSVDEVAASDDRIRLTFGAPGCDVGFDIELVAHTTAAAPAS